MNKQIELLERKLEKMHGLYDENECMIGEYRDNGGPGYHSDLTGIVHGTNVSAEYAAAIFYLKKQKYYSRACSIYKKLAQIQDTDPESKTFGLWSYYMEENLSQMKAPDYNFADFIGKHFIETLSQSGNDIDAKTKSIMETALSNAIECSIRRNVSPDYSNISMMSSMTIISAGELLGNIRFFNIGKARLKKAYEYNKFSNAFSEYNSPTYTILAIAELTRMMMCFKDEECLEWAKELHDIAWENISLYYNNYIEELAPPYKRAYRDLDNGELRSFICASTNGKYGKWEEELNISYLMLPLHCPEKFYPNFEKNGMIEKTYYKQNNIRSEDEDTVIVRNIESPDLKAYTFVSDEYMMGAFDKTDLWNQRRTSMIVWKGKSGKKCFRLKCINGNYDFCSGVVTSDMNEKNMISICGFVKDHGDFHYILDKTNNGVITTDNLSFVFELNGGTEDISIMKSDDVFIIWDDSIKIKLKIFDWKFDGSDAEIRLDEKSKRIELIGYRGKEKIINFNKLKESYGIFAVSVENDIPLTDIQIQDGIVQAKTENNLQVRSFTGIRKFDEFVELK